MTGLVFAVFVPSVMSVAVTVCEPRVLSVTLNERVPAANAPLLGNVAFVSLEVMPTVCVMVFTKFQFASTALTVTLNAVPDAAAVGVPVLPVAVPAAAVSPGTSNCNFTNAPELTVIEGLVLAVLLPSDASEAVRVRLPAVIKVTLKVFVPATSAALDGRMAFESEVVIATVSVLLTGFQFASTALTVTLNAVPAVCAVGEPVLPVLLPGDAVSPGTRSCSLVNAPALTVMAGLVLAVMPACVTSLAVRVQLPAVLLVRAKLLVPETSAALAGRTSFGSVDVMLTVSLVLIKFQFASTALTITLKPVPAVSVEGVPVLPVALPGDAVSPGTSS